MKSLLTLLLVCCLGWVGAQNQLVEVSGRVFYSQEDSPARGVAVTFTFNGNSRTVQTDAAGNYNYSVAATLVIPASGFGKLGVEVRDFCTGQTLSRTLAVSSDSLVFRNVNFTICPNINPPTPAQDCKAFFTYTRSDSSALRFQFKDLSVSSSRITSWNWQFGDGDSSNVQNPTHLYDRPGVYFVRLVITALDSAGNACRALFTSTVYAYNANCPCPRDYNPVCVAQPNGSTIVFPNLCLARCAGFTEAQVSACRDTTCICPAVYAPVCVQLPDGTLKEFGNACEASCQGYTERDFVECRPDSCNCPTDEYVPVCVVVNGDTIEYTNACRAKCAGFTERDFVRCQPNGGCGCPAVYAPVCVALFDGSIKEFPNACEARCAGFEPSVFLPCDSTANCNCPKILDPICAIDPNGDTLTFTNRCFAICEGYRPEQLFSCRPDACLCPPVIDPVCVKLADGQIIRYNSRCEALCKGFKESDIVPCDSTSCVCPEYYDPVCVVVNGDTLTFDNPCFARCKGYTERDWFRCRVDPNCSCPLNLDPVCVKVEGALKQFPNACVARCYGYTERDFVACERDTSDCVCPLYYDPVCAVSPNGDTLTFSNKCFAECAGYSGNQLIRCQRDTTASRCVAAFAISLGDSLPLTIRFLDQARTTEDSIVSWKWDFGDGTTSAARNPVHRFPRAGTYTVTQNIVTARGCTATTTRVIFVSDGNVVEGSVCQAVFTFVQQRDQPNRIQFRNLSFGNYTSVLWEFGDGYTSAERNPTHTYSSNGVFFVRLTVFGENCENTTSMVLFIDPSAVYDNDCNALFLPVLFIDSLQVFFRNLSSADARQFRWDFGDGTTSTEMTPVHTYQQQGIYTVALTITTANGCTNTFRVILNLDTQNFTGNPAFRLAGPTDTDDAAALRAVKLYPNPTSAAFTLEFTAPTAGNYQVQIFSLEGKLLENRRETMAAGTNVLRLDSSALPAGMYLLRLQSEGQTQSLKFIKQ